MKESIGRPRIIAPIRNTWLGTRLFFEGVYYEKRKIEAVNIGTHMAVFLHAGGRVGTIHFREGLTGLSKFEKTPVLLTKRFLTEIDHDHQKLAKAMTDSESPCYPIEEIWGLCALSERWGRRHGYQTKTWATTKQIVDAHEVSIVGRPEVAKLARQEPLTLFFHNRKTFLDEFLGRD